MLTERHLSETFDGRMKVEQNDGYYFSARRVELPDIARAKAGKLK